MKTFVLLLISFCFVACTSQKEINDSPEIVFRSVNVVPMDHETILMNQVVVVKNGKISSIGEEKKVKYSKNAIIVDGQGKYLMPGLAEMHAHVPPVDDLEPMKEVLQLFASQGITTIRGMLGHPKHLELRTKLNNGEIFGPRFITSGPSFNGQSVQSPAHGVQMVKDQKQAGYDFLKIHPGLTKENFDAVARTASEIKIPFSGHVSFHVGIWNAINAKYETIDHMDAFVEGLVPGIDTVQEQNTGLFGMFIAHRADTTQIPKLMKALRENNVWVVPTQALAERWFTPSRTAEEINNDPEMKYMDAKTRENWVNAKNNLSSNPEFDAARMNGFIELRRKLIYECNRNGVGLLLGCDAPQVFNVPGFSTHHELKYLVDAGLTPYEALKTGTINVGIFFKKPDEMGMIKKGAIADLILLNGNPLENITNTQKIEGVLMNNRWMPRHELDSMLKGLEKIN